MRKKFYSLEKGESSADIMIYGDITSWPWLESDVSGYNLTKDIEALDVDTITVGINSYGGEVSEGLAIYNALKRSKAKVVTRCDGFACSAASVVFAAGDERIMNEASLLMIHNAWGYAEGDANALRKAADDMEKITEPSIRAYLAVMDVDEEELRQMMDEETWIDADTALELGLATSVEKIKTDKASQSVRKKVRQMLLNPYKQLVDGDSEDEDENAQNPQDDPENDENNTDSGENGTDSGENDPDSAGNGDDSGENDPDSTGSDGENGADDGGNTDDDSDNDEDKQEQQAQMAAFLRVIQHM